MSNHILQVCTSLYKGKYRELQEHIKLPLPELNSQQGMFTMKAK
jgi:hypothetical protein